MKYSKEEIHELLEYVKDNPKISDTFDKMTEHHIELTCALRLREEEIDRHESTITDKDVEILRLRSLLKEVKEDGDFWYEGSTSRDNAPLTLIETAKRFDNRRALMEKLKQEGV